MDTVVVLTREHEDNLNLLRRLESSGVRVLEYPCVGTRYLPVSEWEISMELRLRDSQVILFTSKRGVLGFRARRDSLSDPSLLIGVVGNRTAETVLRCFDRKPDIVASPPTGEALARSLPARVDPGSFVLHVRGDHTTGNLRDALVCSGYEVAELVVYENIAPELEPLELENPAVVVFASPSAAGRFFDVNRPGPCDHRYVAIGPTTEEFLNGLNVKGVFRAEEPTNESILEKISELIDDGISPAPTGGDMR